MVACLEPRWAEGYRMVVVLPIARQEVEHVDLSSRWVAQKALYLRVAGKYRIANSWPVGRCAVDAFCAG